MNVVIISKEKYEEMVRNGRQAQPPVRPGE